jgi:hypothetical protein
LKRRAKEFWSGRPADRLADPGDLVGRGEQPGRRDLDAVWVCSIGDAVMTD